MYGAAHSSSIVASLRNEEWEIIAEFEAILRCSCSVAKLDQLEAVMVGALAFPLHKRMLAQLRANSANTLEVVYLPP